MRNWVESCETSALGMLESDHRICGEISAQPPAAASANDGIRDESSQAVLRSIMIGVIESRNLLVYFVLRV